MATYTGMNGGTFNNQIPGPDPGDFVTAASIEEVGQAAANQDKILFDRIASAQAVGVIAAHTQIDSKVGIVYTRMATTDNSDYNLAMPAPTGGSKPFLMFKFSGGGSGVARRVWITNTANIAVTAPTDYYAYWEASPNARAGAIFWFDGTLWRHISSYGMTGTTGGGALADV